MKNSLAILFFIPNLIGYFRIALLWAAISIGSSNPGLVSILLISNTLLDALDGYFARKFSQTSQFGAILDYSIDRFSHGSVLLLLATAYPFYLPLFCLILCLDLASHFFHLKSSYLTQQTTHKELDAKDPLLLKLYYQKYVLYAACFSYDLFLVLLFSRKVFFSQLLDLLILLSFIGFVFKITVHLIQLWTATKKILSCED